MKVILENKVIHGVPLIECYTLNALVDKSEISQKPLIFYNHRFDSQKENGYGWIIELARLGFFVVAIDAYRHGERSDTFFQKASNEEKQKKLFDVIIHTGSDINTLFERHYAIKFAEFNVMGVSMGGAVAFYCATLTDKIHGIVSIIGSPSFVEFAKYKMLAQNWSMEDMNTLLSSIESCDPMKHLDHFENIELLMLTGNNDMIVPDKWAKEINQILVERGINKRVTLLSYDVEHEFNQHMKSDILAWCVDRLL